MAKKKTTKTTNTKKEFDARTPFTLYYEGEAVEFKSLEHFNKETGISSAIALDMVLGRYQFEFKGWSNKDGIGNTKVFTDEGHWS